MHLYYLDIWSVVDAMWSCLYGFVLDILCVKHIICTLNCDMRTMSKFSVSRLFVDKLWTHVIQFATASTYLA